MYSALILFTFLVILVPVIAVCPDGWIGVGSDSWCQVTIDPPSCTYPIGALFTNDCDIFAENDSTDGDYCSGGYDNGASVSCEGGYQSQPYYITTSGGNFGNCEVASEDDAGGCNGFEIANPIYWCCSPS